MSCIVFSWPVDLVQHCKLGFQFGIQLAIGIENLIKSCCLDFFMCISFWWRSESLVSFYSDIDSYSYNHLSVFECFSSGSELKA